jgi:hypothetical protein
MVDMLDYRQRLATLAEGLDLADDDAVRGGYGIFVDHLREAFASTPVADLREVAKRLGGGISGRARDAVICGIAYAWAELPAAERVAPEFTGAEVYDLLAEIGTAAAEASRLMGDFEFAASVLRLRSLVDALPTE